MKNKTAVQWLIEQKRKFHAIINDDLEKALAMEKEQMDKVSEDWFVEGCSHMKDNKRIYQSFESYYYETFTEPKND